MMMKRLVLLSCAALGFSLASRAAEARSPMPPRVPMTYKVEGIRAEFLFNAMNKFENVEGLAGTADCGMGTCSAAMKYVTCTKSLEDGPSEIFVGEQNQPFLTCSILSTEPNGVFKNVSYRDNEGVSELRRALVEITAKENTYEKTKSVTVESIDCTAHAVGRQMDSLEVESTFECTIVR
jgi:uncharacterized membrane protein